jgi:hypothetical protein
MNQLTKFLLEDLLGDGEKKITAIYGGGFKPPTKGHFEVVVEAAEQNPEIDDFIIYVGSGTRNGVTQDESIQIWNLYKKYLPKNIRIEPAIKPVGDILRYAKDHPEEKVLWIIGARENNQEDFADISSRTRTLDKYPNLELRVIQTSGGVSGTAARNAVKANDKEQFFNMIPDIAEKQQVWDIVSPIVKEIVTSTEVICDKCGWEWDKKDGGKDLYICHKCGHNNNPDLEEASDPQAGTALPYDSGFAPVKENDPFGLNELARQFMGETLKEMWKPEESFVSLSKYMIDNGMNIKPLPKIKVISDDKDNASNLLGKTAYYNPTDKSITLYTMDRHPKDILRSFSHEMVHHEQNLNGKLNNIKTTNTNEDGALPEIEREAYEKGNMMLRNWEDSLKNV